MAVVFQFGGKLESLNMLKTAEAAEKTGFSDEFARQQLDLLGIGQELSRITYGAAYRLPPSSLPVTEAATSAA